MTLIMKTADLFPNFAGSMQAGDLEAVVHVCVSTFPQFG